MSNDTRTTEERIRTALQAAYFGAKSYRESLPGDMSDRASHSERRHLDALAALDTLTSRLAQSEAIIESLQGMSEWTAEKQSRLEALEAVARKARAFIDDPAYKGAATISVQELETALLDAERVMGR